MIMLALTAWLMWGLRGLPALVEHTEGGSSFLKEQIGVTGLTEEWEWNTALLSTVTGAMTVLLAVRGVFHDPTGSWWSIGVLLMMSALAAALNWQTLRRGYLYAAGILLSTATSVWWLNHWVVQDPDATRFLEINVIALCLSSIACLALELRARRMLGSSKSTAMSFHNVVALWSLVIMGILVLIRLALDVFGVWVPHPRSGWLALSSLVVLMVACIWDRHAKYAVAGVYLAGLLMAGTALAGLDLRPRGLGWVGMMALALYALVTSLIWRWREQVIAWTTQLRIPPRLESECR